TKAINKPLKLSKSFNRFTKEIIFNISMDNSVFIVRCPDYDVVGDKITELIAMMTGMGSFAAAGEKIVLKVPAPAIRTPKEL
ncbi:MAG: hypothetical protein KAT65_05385, partial [Methanophagales archaeon]|nr:hypothetical protein [Methanophagales archaeon]